MTTRGRGGRSHPVATLPRLAGGLVATGGLAVVEGGEDGGEKREFGLGNWDEWIIWSGMIGIWFWRSR